VLVCQASPARSGNDFWGYLLAARVCGGMILGPLATSSEPCDCGGDLSKPERKVV
jgi:hypothetical protein